MQPRCCTVTDAFNSQLKALCVKEFPCGFGTWRIPDFTSSTKKNTTATLVVSPTSRAEVTAQQETTEGLQELSVTVPYDVDCTWSNEASILREIAVKTPEKLSKEFILNHFKSLRIVDRRVTDIDEGLLQFRNLEKFTLSANLISNVDSKKLPADLQELELSANQISDISPLCINPPPLIHLGLSYNKIESIPNQMKPQIWSHLLSLDVSYNNLSHLEDTINILKLLPKLRNLVLQGNPLVLVPGYRGYIIDSIRHLTILDDHRISADEKHYFKGLSKLRDIALDESRLTVAVEVITGVKPPEEIEDPESQAEWPRIEHKYHIEFEFLELPFERVLSPVPSAPTLSITGPDEEESKTITSNNLIQHVEAEPGSLLKNATESLPWAEESIDVNYCKDFHTKKLVELRDFLKEGIDFNVIETKHSYVQEDPNAPAEDTKHITSAKGHQESKDKRKKSGNKEKTDKRKDSAKPKEKGKDGKGKGKGKHDEMELFELPREQRTLGSCHIDLSALVDGEFEITKECICEEEKTNAEAKADDTRSEASGKHGASDKKKSHKGDPAEKQSKGQKQASDKRASQGKAVKGGKEEKGKGKAAKEEEMVHDEEDEVVPPPPLAIKVALMLHHWKSAKEATLTSSS